MAAPIRYVTIDVRLTGAGASTALDEASLPPGESLSLGDGASASRAVLLSEAPPEILSVVADVTAIAASVAALGHWLYTLTRRKGVVVECIGRSTVERLTEDEIVRVIHEEIERRARATLGPAGERVEPTSSERTEANIPVPASIRRIADSGDRQLAWEFFVFFSRFEYALKRSGRYLAGGASRAQPNWDRFGVDNEAAFWADAPEDVEAAVHYFRTTPPRKQVVRSNALAWSEPQTYEAGPELVWLLLMIRTVRNNLFHGGKFPLIHVEEPSRDSELLLHALTILSACLPLDRDLQRKFEQWS